MQHVDNPKGEENLQVYSSHDVPWVSLFGRLVVRSARISADRQTDRHLHTQTNYRNPRCACASRVNYRCTQKTVPAVLRFNLMCRSFSVLHVSVILSSDKALYQDYLLWNKNVIYD